MTVDALVDDLVDSISLFSQICYGIFADRFVDIDTDAVSLGSHAGQICRTETAERI